jgi:hypothetical protein
VGGLDVENHYAMDYEFWGRLMLAGVEIKRTHIDFGIFRKYEGQKISDRVAITRSLVDGARLLIAAHPEWSSEKKAELRHHVDAYWREYKWKARRDAGRRALGSVARRLRNVFSAD